MNIIEILDELNKYSNLIIAFLTFIIIYVSAKSWSISQKTIRLNALPSLFVKISDNKDNISLVIENRSNYPAYDVEVWAIGSFSEKKFPYESLIKFKKEKEIKIDFSKKLYEKYEDDIEYEYYGIVDKFHYYVFPPKSVTSIELDFKNSPDCVYLVIQFRDSMKNNYLHQGYFFRKIDKPSFFQIIDWKYRLKPIKRISYYNSISVKDDIFFGVAYRSLFVKPIYCIYVIYKFLAEKIIFRLYLDREIRDIFLRTIPSGYQRRDVSCTVDNYCDRGRFFDLK